MSQQYGPFYATIQVAFVFPGQGSQFGLSGPPGKSIPGPGESFGGFMGDL